jgi:hypothetical protein
MLSGKRGSDSLAGRDAMPLHWKVLHTETGLQSREAGMKKAKKRVFSIVKAVKQNARDRVGSPPPEKILPDPKQKAAATPKHKETLQDLLQRQAEG